MKVLFMAEFFDPNYINSWNSKFYYCLSFIFQTANQHVHLNFRAINYSAEVYLNGHKEILPKGMFRRHSLNITDILTPSGINMLAVLVHPPDHPGSIPPQGGQGGDHEVCIIFFRLTPFTYVVFFKGFIMFNSIYL